MIYEANQSRLEKRDKERSKEILKETNGDKQI